MSAEPPVGPSAKTVRTVSRLWPLVSGPVALAVVVVGGLLIMARSAAPEFDTWWMTLMVDHRSPALDAAALVFNFVGGGWFSIFVVPVLVIVGLCLARRFWAVAYFTAATVVSVALVQLLKGVFGRVRPLAQLVSSDPGSFPSGHVANAATMAAVLVLLFWRAWLWAAASVYTVLMMLSRTYLGVHWLSDTIGGLLLGVAVAVIVWAPLADRLRDEAKRHAAGNVSG
jgi:membrane-associated phospholipid phosphatase